jgi:hypothetical protein
MEGMGEPTLDFSFEDLEFIGGEIENLDNDGEQGAEATATDPNQVIETTTAPETTEGSETAEEKAAKATEDNKINPNEATTEEDPNKEAPESVSSESAEGKGGEETSPKLYQSLTAVLKEKGVLSSVDEASLDKVEDVDQLVDLLKKQIEAEEFRDLSEEQRTVLKGMREGVSADTANQYKTAMTSLNAITDDKLAEDKQVRFDLIYQEFLSKGFEQDVAIKYANRSFQLKEDVADAKVAKANLITAVEGRYDRSKASELQTQKDEIAQVAKDKNDLKEAILTTEQPIGKVKIPDNVRKEVYEDMVKIVSTNPTTGEAENELMKFQREKPTDYAHKLYYLWKVTNGFKDLEYFGRKSNTSNVKNLENAIRQSTHVSGGGNTNFSDDVNASALDIGDLVLPE